MTGGAEAIRVLLGKYPEITLAGAICYEGVDERDLVRVRIGQARYGDPTPNVTIAPTLACNFRCSYCDQPNEARAQTMDDDTANAVITYLDEKLSRSDDFSVTWYGGEPLLALARLLSMQDAILSLCAKRGIGVFTNVVTNGWFLDSLTAQRLANAGVRQVQVTLDGPPAIHDARRPTHDGLPTFDRIVENVHAAREHMDVRLRTNLDRHNASHLPRLLDLLTAHGLLENLYLAPVVCYEAPTPGSETPFLDGPTMGDILASCIDRLAPDDAAIRLTPASLPCTALREATYVFGPTGHVYRCWHELGHPELAVDHVQAGPGNRARRLFWMTYDPLAYPECSECRVLPLCVGGCPEQRRRGIQPPMGCSPARSHLGEFVVDYRKKQLG